MESGESVMHRAVYSFLRSTQVQHEGCVIRVFMAPTSSRYQRR
jgi:hypothetical protein